jgi:dimethylaniline monooxygenase (N-oxide forming)
MCGVAGPVFPIIEMQARWAARVFSGAARLPEPAIRAAAIDKHLAWHWQRGTSPMRVQLADYMDEIAAEIGARPQLLRHPTLLGRLLLDPLLSAQYRLDGPGKFDKAIDSIVGQ